VEHEDIYSPGTQQTSDTYPESDLDAEGEPEPDLEEEQREKEKERWRRTGVRPYVLRQRQKINYAIPPPLEEMTRPPPPTHPPPSRKHTKGPGWSTSGAELGCWMGMGGNGEPRACMEGPFPSFNSLAITSDAVMHKYTANYRDTAEDKEQLPPQIFQFANNAYYHMRHTTQDLAIIFTFVSSLHYELYSPFCSGETTSGKSETAGSPLKRC
jgi:hypothetical protein